MEYRINWEIYTSYSGAAGMLLRINRKFTMGIVYLGYHGNGRHFDFFQSPKAATHYGGYSYKVSWSLMKGIQNYFKSPFFVSMATAAKFVQPIPIFFGLSRSTRCGCCSYQISSISVRRITCYDHFCVFQFLKKFAVSMATAAILKIPRVVCTSTHSA
jgi:hypothetical protein